MAEKIPKIGINILCIRDNKFLMGLLTKKWMFEGKQVYGIPGRDLHFGENIGDAVKRNIMEEIGCELLNYEIIAVNTNHAWGNHYVGIGVKAEILGAPKLNFPEDWERWEWINAEKIPDNLFPDAKSLIECYKDKKFTVTE